MENLQYLKKFYKNVKVNIIDFDEEDNRLVFDLIGVDASFANALRRIMISEIPTMAIEGVSIISNDSSIPDEVLVHRLGLIPLIGDATTYKDWGGSFRESKLNKNNTIMYTLDVKGEKNQMQADDTCHVLSEMLKLEKTIKSPPFPKEDAVEGEEKEEQEQEEIVRSSNTGELVHKDILLAKLKPGQTIKLHCYARKGVGALHAKWSPVCGASYRIHPKVEITQPIKNKQDALELKNLCPQQVFDVEDSGLAIVSDERACSMCMECKRVGKSKDSIGLGRRENHFVFSVESVGQISPFDIVERALQILMEKCDTAQKGVAEMQKSE